MFTFERQMTVARGRACACTLLFIYTASPLVPISSNVHAQCVHGDSNGDNDVTLTDFSEFVSCRNDSSVSLLPTECAAHDFDGNGNIDLVDWGRLQRTFGESRPRIYGSPTLHAPGAPFALTSGDLDDNGRLDLVTGSLTPHFVSVFLNHGEIGHSAYQPYPFGSHCRDVAVGDVNDDGHPDLVISSTGIMVMVGIGDGSFAPPVTINGSHGVRELAVGDVNNDGLVDIVSVHVPVDEMAVFLNAGRGEFSEPVRYQVGEGPEFVQLADFDGDADLDAIITNSDSRDFSILLNEGDGSYLAETRLAVEASPGPMAVGDFDLDGDADVAVIAFSFEHDVWILENSGDSTFSASPFALANDIPQSIVAEDLNRDGSPDLVTANRSGESVTVFLNDGRGNLAIRTDYKVGYQPYAVTTGDLDGDSYADIAVANLQDESISVLLNNRDGTFSEPLLPAGEEPNRVYLTEFNSDQHPDIVVSYAGGEFVSVFVSEGNGHFVDEARYAHGLFVSDSASVDVTGDGFADLVLNSGHILENNGAGEFDNLYSFGDRHAAVAACDIDNDGDNDIIGVDIDNRECLNVFANQGGGSFVVSQRECLLVDASAVACVDVDGDSFSEIVATGVYSSFVQLVRNDGTGTLSYDQHWAVWTGSEMIAVADVDLDGDLDLATGGSGGAQCTLLYNLDGNGDFEPVIVDIGAATSSIAFADVNGDSFPDIVSAHFYTHVVSVSLNDGNGQFTEAHDVVGFFGPWFATPGDLDLDGDIDVAVANIISDNISLLENLCVP